MITNTETRAKEQVKKQGGKIEEFTLIKGFT